MYFKTRIEYGLSFTLNGELYAVSDKMHFVCSAASAFVRKANSVQF
jgi:hypothetical protein